MCAASEYKASVSTNHTAAGASHSTQLANFIRVLRALDMLEPFDNPIPEPNIKPYAAA